MSTDESKSRSFPNIPATAWWGIRARWQKNLPKTAVNAQHIETVLNIKEKSAKNIVPQLRTLGLIDDDGMPTSLANDWRTDEGYPGVCRTIIETVYPEELRDAVPPERDLERDAATRWFVRERKVGEGAGRQMAAMYALIAEADPAGQENVRAQRGEGAATERTPRRTGTSGRLARTTVRTQQRQEDPPPPPPPPRDNDRSASPSLHIDVNVHIASDATPEQIEAIFSSMAKHLYQRKS